MPHRIFVISDIHFGHTNCWAKFTRENGDPLRPFTSTEEMDEVMIANWNNVVKPEDHVYVLGDVAIKKAELQKCTRLMGKKRLVRGNHDIYKTQEYIDVGFEEIWGVRVFREGDGAGVPDCVLTHVPIHPDCIARWGVNVHGHLHANLIRLAHGGPDPRYVSACVEHLNYTPILLGDLVDLAGKQG